MIDPLTSLQLGHNHWSTAQILARCGALAPGGFDRGFPIGPGSLRATTAHIAESMFYFADNFAGRDYVERPGIGDPALTPARVQALLDESHADLTASIGFYFSTHSFAGTVHWRLAGIHLPAPAALAQVFDHGSHHRAQCLNMLRQLGALAQDLDINPMDYIIASTKK